MSVEYLQINLILYLPNFVTNGRLAEYRLMSFPELCKASCLFFTSFNEYMCLMVKLGTVPSNFVKSMKLNVDVIGKKRKVEQDRRTCI